MANGPRAYQERLRRVTRATWTDSASDFAASWWSPEQQRRLRPPRAKHPCRCFVPTQPANRCACLDFEKPHKPEMICPGLDGPIHPRPSTPAQPLRLLARADHGRTVRAACLLLQKPWAPAPQEWHHQLFVLLTALLSCILSQAFTLFDSSGATVIPFLTTLT